jgi:nucleoside-diphosphate-sugar epimerase
MSIRWITSKLGTAPALQFEVADDMNVIDVRDLVDKGGNNVEAVRQKIAAGHESLRSGKRTVVCCDYGISRSNAIAAGILAKHESLPFGAAARRVLQATGETEVKLGPLEAVRLALGEQTGAGERSAERILVTGAAGSIGRALIPRLARELEVVPLIRAQTDLLQGSTILHLLARDASPKFMLHLANPRIHTSARAVGESVTMLRNVLDVCVTQGLHLVYLSGWEVYSGYRSRALLADESLPLLPRGPHGEAKYLCELLVSHYRRTQGLRCTMIRSSPVYGPGFDKPKFIYNFIDKVQRSEPVTTHRYTNADAALDLLYTDDLVEAVAALLKTSAIGDFNVGTGVLTSTATVARTIRDLLGGRSEIGSVPIDEDAACIAMDSRKAFEVSGWRPAVSATDGLKRVLAAHNEEER